MRSVSLHRGLAQVKKRLLPSALALLFLLIFGVATLVYWDARAAQLRLAQDSLLNEVELAALHLADHVQLAVAEGQSDAARTAALLHEGRAQLASIVGAGRATQAAIVARNGDVIVDAAAEAAYQAPPVVLAGLTQQQRGAVELTLPEHGATLVAYGPIPDIDWGIVLSQPRAAALAPMTRTGRLLFGSMALLYGLLSAATIVAGRSHRRNLELLQQVQRYSADLQEETQRAQAAERAKTAFMVSIGHEFRTPLTNIIAYTDLLAHGKPEKRDRYLDVLTEETRHLRSLVLTVLDLTALEGGEVQLKLTPTGLNTLINDLVCDWLARATQQRLALEIELAPDLPRIAADPPWLARAIQVLLDNALTYTPADGRVAVRTAALDDGLCVSVSDTGPGIPVEEQQHIFERFYRGATQAPGHIRGIGLGLAICHEIVEQHGGQVRVTSQVGQGSRFTIWLPVPKEDSRPGLQINSRAAGIRDAGKLYLARP